MKGKKRYLSDLMNKTLHSPELGNKDFRELQYTELYAAVFRPPTKENTLYVCV